MTTLLRSKIARLLCSHLIQYFKTSLYGCGKYSSERQTTIVCSIARPRNEQRNKCTTREEGENLKDVRGVSKMPNKMSAKDADVQDG